VTSRRDLYAQVSELLDRQPLASSSDTVSGVLAVSRQIANRPGRVIGAIAPTVLLMGVLPLAGCGSLLGSAGNEPQQPAPSASVSPPSSSSAPPATNLPATPSAGATASGTPNGAPTELGAPAATRDGTADEQKATLAVYPVRRSDTLAVMHFTVAVDTNADDGIFVFDLFGDGDSTTGDASSSTSVDGVRLVDSARRKVYLPASDGKGNCLCSRDLKGDLEPGHTYTFYATYAAPPAEVSVLDVSFPQFGTVSRVPVQ
jgi:hypothetical protein